MDTFSVVSSWPNCHASKLSGNLSSGGVTQMTLLETYYGSKTVLVTGATSGNGRALAYRLRELGAEVYGIGRNAQCLSELNDCGIHAFHLDLTPDDHCDSFVKSDLKDIRFDYVFHLAGSAFFDNPDPQTKVQLRTSDLLGPTYLLERLLLARRLNPGGTVAVVTSGSAGLGDIPRIQNYQEIKREMVVWWRRNRDWFVAHGSNLMLISMGFIGTDIWKRAPGLPSWARTLATLVLPKPERFTDLILTDAANWEPVSYPGWFADLVPIDTVTGGYRGKAFTQAALTILGRFMGAGHK